MGGPERVERQHRGGRYTVRERIEKMVDPGSFIEAGSLMGAAEYDDEGNLRSFAPGGYVMGLAEIDGRPVAIGGDDFTISGGTILILFACDCATIQKIGLDAEGTVMQAAHKTYVERRDGSYWIAGTRISLDSVIYAYQCGAAPESIQRSYPLLTLEEVYGAIAFYLGNQQEIDAYLEQSEVEDARTAEKMQTSFRTDNPALVKRLEKARYSRGPASS